MGEERAKYEREHKMDLRFMRTIPALGDRKYAEFLILTVNKDKTSIF